MSPRAFAFLLTPCILMFVLLGGACVPDPVQSDAIALLGPEAPGVRRGPLHRPGQPCLLCHDGAIGDPPEFTVAGTIYQTPTAVPDLQGVTGATVSLTDSSGNSYQATTNTAGNFYVTPDEYSPVFPLVTITVTSGETVTMLSESGRSGACATCHVYPAGPSSPGQVVMTTANGGTPP